MHESARQRRRAQAREAPIMSGGWQAVPAEIAQIIAQALP
jgi:hypothetical protein